MGQVIKPKKYIRTQMKLDSGEIVDARICVAIGEIKPHKYPVVKPMTKAKALPVGETNGIVSEEPSWMRIPAPVYGGSENAGTKSWKNKSNPNNVYLKDFMMYSDAIEEHPILEDLMTGTTSLGEGGKNFINKGVLFCMLRDLDEINVHTIREYTGHSEAHCYRLAHYLRVLSTAFDTEVEK